jgi:hypothetical protein
VFAVIAALAAVPAVPAAAQAIRVVIDGQPVSFDVPPVEIQGRVLVPLRGIFERLGAYVEYNAPTRTIDARRGGTTVRLQLGSRVAHINGAPTTLGVPAMSVRGRAMVPLRFVSEALGAVVEWDGAMSTVFITTGGAQVPPPQRFTPPPVPPAPPVAQPSVIDGVLIAVNTPQSRITVQRENLAYTVAVTADTAITRIDVDTNTGGSVSLVELRPGDQVRVTVDANNRAIAIRATYRVASGRIEAVTASVIVLNNGESFRFSPNVGVTIDGRDARIADLRAGMAATLRINPQSNVVWAVEARRTVGAPAPTPPPAVGAVTVTSFTHNAQRPLGAGETLTVTLRGTAGGRATFSIGDQIRDVAMNETQPGVYVGMYTVRPGDNLVNVPVFGRLVVGNASSPMVQSGTPLTLDTTAPRVVDVAPTNGARINNNRPNIVVVADDGEGSGIATFRLVVQGQDVTAQATRSDRIISYNPPEAFRDGPVTVRVRVTDRAGNSTDFQWSFTVAAQAAVIQSVTFGPNRPLTAGDVLTVVMVAEPRGRAAFSIEGVVANVPMAEQEAGRYVGTYTVRPGENVNQAAITVTLVRRTGETVTAMASGGVVIATARPAGPTIDQPRPGQTVASPLTIRGRATPGYRVRVLVTYEGNLGPVVMRGRLGEVEITADADGNWAATVRYPIALRGARITITAVTISPTGQQSEPATVHVIQQ